MEKSSLSAILLLAFASSTAYGACIIGDGSPIECDWTVNLGTVTTTPTQACLPAKPNEGIPSPVCWEISPTAAGAFSIGTLYDSSEAGKKYVNVVTFTGIYDVSGYVGLKYQILAIDYAPPGAKSYVNYGSSAMRGTNTTNSNTWMNTVSLSVEQGLGADIFGVVGADLTATLSTSYTQESDTTTSLTVATTTTETEVIDGPSSSAVGVDHAYDVIWVWLNPAVEFTLTGPSSIQWDGYNFNIADTSGEMEVVPLYVSWLQNPSTIPADVATRLARSWDTSGLGGLNSADYKAILAADPYVSASYNPNTDASHRFDLQAGYTFNYEPPPAGGQPITETYALSTTTTSSLGQGASYTYSVGIAFDLTTNASFLATVKSDTKISDTYTATDKWSSTINSATGKTATLSITGPAVSDNYKGPTTIQVWRDNIYGSFMFYPVQ